MQCKFCGICKKHAGGNGNLIINFAWPREFLPSLAPFCFTLFVATKPLVLKFLQSLSWSLYM